MPSTRTAIPDDLGLIARIHKQAYSADHFTSLLPLETLSAYYGLFIGNGAETLLLIDDRLSAADDEKIIGFAVFGRNIEQRIAQFKREHVMSIVLTSVRHPWRAAGKVLRQFANRLTPRDAFQPAPYLLLSIAVAEPGRGAGQALLAAMIKRAARDDATAIGLYVQLDNASAIMTYVKSGFSIVAKISDQYYMEKQITIL